jgi:hypothetical protein
MLPADELDSRTALTQGVCERQAAHDMAGADL